MVFVNTALLEIIISEYVEVISNKSNRERKRIRAKNQLIVLCVFESGISNQKLIMLFPQKHSSLENARPYSGFLQMQIGCTNIKIICQNTLSFIKIGQSSH